MKSPHVLLIAIATLFLIRSCYFNAKYDREYRERIEEQERKKRIREEALVEHHRQLALTSKWGAFNSITQAPVIGADSKEELIRVVLMLDTRPGHYVTNEDSTRLTVTFGSRSITYIFKQQ